MAASMRCSWRQNRSKKPPSGWRSIANSGKGRLIAWPITWKRQARPPVRRERVKPMCPACVTNIVLLAAGTASGGGLTAFTLAKLFKRKQTNRTEEYQNETARVGTQQGNDGNGSRNSVGS